MDHVIANSINYLATSIEAVAARLRGAVGKPGAQDVLEWAGAELERLSGDATSIAPEAGDEPAVPFQATGDQVQL